MEEKAPKPQPIIASKSDVRSSTSLDAPKRIKLRRSWNPLVLEREVEKLEKTPMKVSVESSTGEKLSRKRNAEECLLMDEAKKPIASPIFEFELCAFKSPLHAPEVPFLEEPRTCKISLLDPEIPVLEEPCLCKSPLLAPQIPIVEEWHVPSPTQLKSRLEAPVQEACTPNSSPISEIKLSVIAAEVESLEKTNMKVSEELTAGKKPAKKRKAEESLPTDVANNPIDSPFLKLEPHACKSTLLDTEVPVLEESHDLSPKRLKPSLETPVPEACIPNRSPISAKLCEISSTSPGESSMSTEDSLEKLMEFWMQYYEEGMDLEYGKTIEELLQEIYRM